MPLVGWVRPHARAGGPRETQIDRRPCWLPARSGVHAGADSDLGPDLGALPRPQLETRNLDDPPRRSRPNAGTRNSATAGHHRSRRFSTSWAPSTIFSAVSPYLWRSSSASPLSPKTSWTPTIAMGTGGFAAIASLIWWVAPSGPTVRPACEQKIFTFRFVYATFCRITLYVCADPNTLYVEAKGILPAAASPAATLIMFGSAIPSWKRRSGNALPNSIVLIDSVVSAPTTTTFGLRRPRSMRAFAKYDRWLSCFHGGAVRTPPPSPRAPRGRASTRHRSSRRRDT